MTLYEIESGIEQLMDSWDSLGEAERQEAWETLCAMFADKAAGYAKAIRSYEAQAAMFDAEAKALSAKAKSAAARAARLKDAVRAAMERRGVDRVGAGLFQVRLVPNGGKAPVRLLTEDVPAEYTKTTVAPDMEKIREALEDGELLPFAELGERGSHVRIA